MFAIKAPQTITLNVPGEDKPDATINFKTNDADSSRCVMEIIYPDGEVHRLVFNTRGSLIDSSYTVPTDEPDLSEEERRNEAGPTSHMVDGRDMRAFDPYEYKPPITDADAAYRDPNAGFTTPQSDEMREQGEKDRQEAAERAKDLRQEVVDRANEKPEDRAERERQAEQDRLDALSKGEAKDPNVTKDTATAETFPSQKTQDLVEGKKMDGSPQSNPDNAPMAPAPSSPQPGSPPPHPLDQPDPGRVTTSSDFSAEPAGIAAEQRRADRARKDNPDAPTAG